MMKTARVIALVVLSGLCLPAALAAGKTGKGAVEVERPDEILNETDTFLSAPAQPGSGKTLRCWQYGRLLYEGSGFNALTSPDKTSVTISRQKGDNVNIINLQDGLCILSGH